MRRKFEGKNLDRLDEGWLCMRCHAVSHDWIDECPECGSENIEDVFFCYECGEPVDSFLTWKHGGLCEKCFTDEATHLNTAVEYGNRVRLDVSINGLFEKAFTQEQIDDILCAAFVQLPEEKQHEIEMEFCTDDAPYFVEWLGGMHDD